MRRDFDAKGRVDTVTGGAGEVMRGRGRGQEGGSSSARRESTWVGLTTLGQRWFSESDRRRSCLEAKHAGLKGAAHGLGWGVSPR